MKRIVMVICFLAVASIAFAQLATDEISYLKKFAEVNKLEYLIIKKNDEMRVEMDIVRNQYEAEIAILEAQLATLKAEIMALQEK